MQILLDSAPLDAWMANKNPTRIIIAPQLQIKFCSIDILSQLHFKFVPRFDGRRRHDQISKRDRIAQLVYREIKIWILISEATGDSPSEKLTLIFQIFVVALFASFGKSLFCGLRLYRVLCL